MTADQFSFYQVKMIRKGTKPPIWRRAYVPADITFSQMALLLMEMLELGIGENFVFEFFQKKDRIVESEDFVLPDYDYDYYPASKTCVNSRFDQEKWFTFRLLTSDNLYPEYRVEIEKKISPVFKYQDGERPLDHPLIIKGVTNDQTTGWTDGKRINDHLKDYYTMKSGEANHLTVSELQERMTAGSKGLTICRDLKNPETKIRESSVSRSQRLTDLLLENISAEKDWQDLIDSLNIDREQGTMGVSEEEANTRINAFLNSISDQIQAAAKEQLDNSEITTNDKLLLKKLAEKKNAPASAGKKRHPKMDEYLSGTYTLDELKELAAELNLHFSGRRKDKIAWEITRQLLTADKMKEVLLLADEKALDQFEAAMEKGCYRPDEDEWNALSELGEYGYIIGYRDQYVEVPEEVKTIYSVLLKNGYREFHSRASWLIDCLDAFASLLAVGPEDILYKMYKRRREFKQDPYERFQEILRAIPDYLNECRIKDGLVFAVGTLKDRLYLDIRKSQRNVDYYIPTKEEIETIVRQLYPANEEAYQKLYRFYQNMKLDETTCIQLCATAFMVFAGGGMLSDYMEALNEEKIIFPSAKSGEQFGRIMMEVNNNTRMYILRGHKPVEMSALRQKGIAAFERTDQRPTIIPMSSLSANMLEEGRSEIEKMGFRIDTDSNAATIPALNFPSGSGSKPVTAEKKIYPNDPCPCGSGKKYKKCCGKNR